MSSPKQQQDASAKQLKLSKKTFNAISMAFIEQLTRLFPGCGKLLFIRGELERFSKDPSASHVPAVKFFKTMNLPTNIKNEDGVVVVGELIVRRNPAVFTDDLGVSVPELDAIGMKEKWEKLSPANREFVWSYLERMAKTSAQVVITAQFANGKAQEAIAAVREHFPVQ